MNLVAPHNTESNLVNPNGTFGILKIYLVLIHYDTKNYTNAQIQFEVLMSRVSNMTPVISVFSWESSECSYSGIDNR